MVHFFNYDEDLVTACVEEFVSAKYPGAEFSFACIYRASDFPDTRQVFLLDVAGQHFALKLDLTSPETGRLTREFEHLLQLQAHFSGHKRASVTKPVYLSPQGNFFITEYVGRKTATDAIYELEQDNRAAQVYRRAGEWLHVLHSFTPARHEPFWPQWMFETLEAILSSSTPQAAPAEHRPMLDQLRQEADRISGTSELRVFSHGDFHGKNLILDTGHVYGLDFTEAHEKLAIYDIVDFLKMDVFRPGGPSQIDRSGILTQNKDMFFKRYRHPINMDVLDVSMRARLLIDWLSISRERYESTRFQARKFDRLRTRLLLTFDIPM